VKFIAVIRNFWVVNFRNSCILTLVGWNNELETMMTHFEKLVARLEELESKDYLTQVEENERHWISEKLKDWASDIEFSF